MNHYSSLVGLALTAASMFAVSGCHPNGQAAAAAVAPDPAGKAAFNLICSGTTSSGTESGHVTTAPFEMVFRVDLKANRWCLGACKETKAIASVSDAEIILNPVPAGPVRSAYNAIRISRESGSIDARLHVGEWEALSVGDCTRAPFTGFPAAKF